jgi:NADH/NAD ratio-sensing transcriptional regulator Rex
LKDLFSINEEIYRFETVIIYGAGAAGKNMIFKLLQRDVKVECIADSDPIKCGTKLLNVPVKHIDELTSYCESAAVIVTGWSAPKIAALLKQRGWKHIFFDYGNEVGLVHLNMEDA